MRKRLFIGIFIIVLTGVLFAWSHFSSKNKLRDPRIVRALELYNEYNGLAVSNNFKGVFDLMDSIENIYLKIPFYVNSYEIGVLYNNRCATLLTLAMLHDTAIYARQIDSLVNLAGMHAKKSISIYESWLGNYEKFDIHQFDSMVRKEYQSAFSDSIGHKQLDKMIAFKTNQFKDAVQENKRRLSVVYTNLGVIHRFFKEYKEAAMCYDRAIGLWEKNLTAQNNLNKLLGRPLVKRNFIQKLFPSGK